MDKDAIRRSVTDAVKNFQQLESQDGFLTVGYAKVVERFEEDDIVRRDLKTIRDEMNYATDLISIGH